ncbi:MAG TPA: hypothetical protein VF941_22255 [Clostridia bacterium]
MKKAFLILFKLVVLSIVLQSLCYFFIDNFYIGDHTNIIDKIEISQISKACFGQSSSGVNINVKGVPDSASDIQVSYDSSYVSYIDKGNLVIIDSSTGKKSKTLENRFPPQEGKHKSDDVKANIDWYSWYPDRNTILYTLSAPENSPGRVQLMTYDASSGNTQEGNSITNIPEGSKVTNATFSSLTMTVYMHIKESSSQAEVYRINIMNNILSPYSLPLNAVLKCGYYNTDNLLFQNSQNQIFIKKGVNSPRQINLKKKSSLINVSGDSKEGKDIAYIGELNENGKVNNIIYGDMTSDPAKWLSLPLKTPCDVKDLIVKNNMVYQISQNSLINLKDNNEVKYDGRFIDIVDTGVIYLDKNNVKSKSFYAKS